jgi:hypothetical protein
VKKILATGFDDYIDEDKPALYVSHGAGNLSGVDEVHLEVVDPEDGSTVRLWVRRDDLLAAIG